MMNVFIHLVLLSGTSRLVKRKLSKKRLWLVSLLSSSTIFLILTPWEFWLFHPAAKVIVACLVVFAAFGFSSLQSYIQCVFMFYMMSFLAAGIMLALETWRYSIQTNYSALTEYVSFMYNSFSFILILSSVPIIWITYRWTDQMTKIRKRKISKLTEVTVEVGSHTYEGTALIDTGNELKDPITRAPVMVMELAQLKGTWHDKDYEILSKILKDNRMENLEKVEVWQDRWRLVPYRSAGQDLRMMIAFKPDRVTVHQKNETITFDSFLVGLEPGHLSSSNDFTMVFPADPLETSSHATA